MSANLPPLTPPYAAFSGYGIEIEYMIVDAVTLNVSPIADVLLTEAGGAEDMDVPRGEAAWSNELALHVVEIKTAGPARDLLHARSVLREQVDELRKRLARHGATLLPTGMHPWMNPLSETRLWPHQNNVIYQTFDRIFNCQGHGWSNLQSTHINFPFHGAEEFARVHAACRFVLPLLPALAASSPFQDGRRSPHLDARLNAYLGNCTRVPSVSGMIVPERVYTEEAYERLLQGIYADLSPYDPEGILAEEWVNARGCIARFDRGAVEIRLLDAQECPEQDLAIVAFVTTLVEALARGQILPLDDLMTWSEQDLSEILLEAISRGGDASALRHGYAKAFGSEGSDLRSLLRDLIERLIEKTSPHRPGLDIILREGCLAARLLRRFEGGTELFPLYRELAECLATGQPFSA